MQSTIPDELQLTLHYSVLQGIEKSSANDRVTGVSVNMSTINGEGEAGMSQILFRKL